MFIFDNNFNLLCSPSENETPTKKGRRKKEKKALRILLEMRRVLSLFNIKVNKNLK